MLIVKKYLFILLFLFLPVFLVAQNESSVSGIVKNEEGAPVEMVQIVIKETNQSVFTGTNGTYLMEHIKPGNYTLVFLLLGYDTKEQKITLKANDKIKANASLKQLSKQLGEVEVVARTQAQEIKESAYTVSVIDTKPLKIKDADVNKILNKTTGVRIREDGGMGSDFNFSLNGFSGSQVKFFIDGIPMDNFGSSFSLNNLPINLVDRIEIYKGVVPVFLGSDALGGAVNIVTNQKAQSFLDASYSFGSFNQHRAAVAGRYTHRKSGFTVSANVFFNYADNNYFVDVKIPDPLTGKVGGTEKVRKFHDGYQSQGGQFETGFINKKFADRLLLGVIVSSNHKEIQNGYNMTQVAGHVYNTDKVIIPTLKYQKKNLFVKGLQLNSFSTYNTSQSLRSDTSSRKYDWRGNFTTKTIDRSGELSWDKTLFRFNDQSALNTTNLSYQLNELHSISICNTYNWFTRVGDDPLAYNPIPFDKPNTITKNIGAIAYGLDLFKKRWSTNVFGKTYNLKTVTQFRDAQDNLQPQIVKFDFMGYGIASTYFMQKWAQIKLSYENACRLPESYEVFGDGLLVQPNITLKPEQSKNYNAGFLINKNLGKKHFLVVEGNYLYREPRNLIRVAASTVTSSSENLAKVSISCWEGGAKYVYNNTWTIEANGTYQNVLNTNKYEPNGLESVLYMDRIPNMPFLFGNAKLSYMKDNLFGKGIKILIDWSTTYVEAFYLKWPSQGNKDDKYDIPQQIAHQASVSCSFKEGTYNISLSCSNLTDALIYDNFMMQKPGRAFNIKFGYFISNNK